MSEVDPEHEQGADDIVAPEPIDELATTGARSRRKFLTTIGITVGAVLLVGVVALVVVSAIQPTAIERAGDACSGSKPLQALFDDLESTASPDASDADAQGDKGDSEFADLFVGVVSVEDSGKSLIVKTKSQEEDLLGISSLALDCVYTELDVPTYISERISATRALDGRQDGEWDGFSASWSYHPDSGANVIIVQD